MVNCLFCLHTMAKHSPLAGCMEYADDTYCDCAVKPGPPMIPAPRLPEPPPSIAHDGATYAPIVDGKPLAAQTQAVYRVMANGRWCTLAELAFATSAPESSVSARLRDLRKPKWGGHNVQRRRRGPGRQWEYAIVTVEQT